MNDLQNLIYNAGERLVPYVSHNEDELVRHRSSYAFFHSIISLDLNNSQIEKKSETTIIDLGFGTGYGCALLSSLPQSKITGVDIEPVCEVFAEQYYPRSNVSYFIEDLTTYIPKMERFDYAVSRGVLEHVPDGLNLIKKISFNKRVMIDVPYDEAPGNEHHVLTGIREDAFSLLENYEIFYEDLQGAIYDKTCRPPRPNMIMIVISSPNLPKISELCKFPIAPIKSDQLEIDSRKNIIGKRFYYNDSNELLSAINNVIKETDVVADIGCGILPMNYFRPKIHFLVEPFKEYSDILSHRHANDKSVIVLKMNALEALSGFADNSVDSVFLLDVIEHMDKDEGLKVLEHCERVAREQIIIFTPLGFMKQHVNETEKDAWGLSGHEFQEHRSGWDHNDFPPEWSFHICNEFHTVDHHKVPLEKPFGAFFAIRNFENKVPQKPTVTSDLRRPLPSELALRQMEKNCKMLEYENTILIVKNEMLQKKIINRVASSLKRAFKMVFVTT